MAALQIRFLRIACHQRQLETLQVVADQLLILAGIGLFILAPGSIAIGRPQRANASHGARIVLVEIENGPRLAEIGFCQRRHVKPAHMDQGEILCRTQLFRHRFAQEDGVVVQRARPRIGAQCRAPRHGIAVAGDDLKQGMQGTIERKRNHPLGMAAREGSWARPHHAGRTRVPPPGSR